MAGIFHRYDPQSYKLFRSEYLQIFLNHHKYTRNKKKKFLANDLQYYLKHIINQLYV